MNAKDLREYLGIVVDMEENIFMQKTLISNMEQELNRLKIPKRVIDPAEPIKPKELVGSGKKYGIIGILIGGVGLFFLTFFIACIIYAAYHYDEKVDQILSPFLIIVPVIWMFYCIAKDKKATEKFMQKKVVIENTYQMELREYRRTIENNERQRKQDEAERTVKTIFLESQKAEAIKSLSISTEHLKKIYEKDIIFPKYRNLVMACSLYEYFCAGRCDALEGHEGAYNILETEIRLDRIVSQLDQVITHLERIEQNQFMLYSVIQRSNQWLGQIMDSTNRMTSRLEDFYSYSVQLNDQAAELNTRIAELQASSALTAYHAERTQKELAYMNRMDYLSGRNDDVFWNHPPV